MDKNPYNKQCEIKKCNHWSDFIISENLERKYVCKDHWLEHKFKIIDEKRKCNY